MNQTSLSENQPVKPWKSEKDVGIELAKSLISHQFRELMPVSLQLLGTGWDNLVYLVNRDYVFRFPRRSMALPLIHTEWKLLETLAPTISLAIPIPKFKGLPSEKFEWPFAGYTLVSGLTADRARLGEACRRDCIPALAGFLSELHGQTAEFTRSLALPGDLMAKVDIPQRLPQTSQRLKQVHSMGLISDITIFEKFLASLPSENPPNRMTCLVHGDLYVRHLVLDSELQISGVIDWGDAHVGDPATDLSLVYAFLPPSSHSFFWSCYGDVDPMTRTLARFRALLHSLLLLLYAHDTNDSDLLHESLLSLTFISDSFQTEPIV